MYIEIVIRVIFHENSRHFWKYRTGAEQKKKKKEVNPRRKRSDRETAEKVGSEGQRADTADTELDRANILRVLRHENN